jgi:Reverse transcriptase (RNA-dependent DNA polymerase)
MPTVEAFGYLFVVDAVDDVVKAFDNIEPIKYKDMFDVPLTFEQAWNHPCPWQCSCWRTAILLELAKMRRMCVWKKVKRSQIPHGRKCIKCKWVFDIKRNGVFRACLVACGYSQVPGIDFQDAYSQVINDATFCLILLIQLVLKLKARLADVEIAFLHGDLDEEIYMNYFPGLEHQPDECVLLLKALYSLVQAAHQFFRKFTDIMKSIGF